MRFLFYILVLIIFGSCNQDYGEVNKLIVQNKTIDTTVFTSQINLNDYKINPTNFFIKDSLLIVTEHNDKKLHLIDLTTQSLLWSVEVDNWCTTPPIIAQEAIYYVSYTGLVSKYDFKGNLLWNHKVIHSYKSHLINPISGNLIITTVVSGLYELKDNGDILWKVETNNVSKISNPQFFDSGIILSGFHKENYDTTYIRCYDKSMTKIIWEIGFPSDVNFILSEPIIVSNTVVFNSGFQTKNISFKFIDIHTGKIKDTLKYSYNGSNSELSYVNAVDSFLFFSERDSILTVFDINQMKEIKNVKMPFPFIYYSIYKVNGKWVFLLPEALLLLDDGFTVFQEIYNVKGTNFKNNEPYFLTKENDVFRLIDKQEILK